MVPFRIGVERWLAAVSMVWYFLAPAYAADKFELSFPVECTLGENCWIQNLVDIDQGPKRLDAFCRGATYNTHKGTDVRLKANPDIKRNVMALAMAPGKVVALRNDQPDRMVEGASDIKKVRGKECGNGALVVHAGGWSTQYCHLAKDSVVVKKGQTVKRGDPIGAIGLSGHTTFPHVHINVRKGKTIIDPMTGESQNKACHSDQTLPVTTLWDAAARQQITGAMSQILDAGFTSATINSKQFVKGEIPPPKQKGPFVFYAHMINVEKGDRVEMQIDGPDGVYAKGKAEPIKGPKAVWTSFVGKRRSVKPGVTYTGSAKLVRDGKVIAERSGVEIRF